MIVSQLFEGFRLGGIELRNRIVKAAAFEGMSPGGRPSAALIEHHRRVAAGGAGICTVAYAAVSPSGRTFAHQMWLHDEVMRLVALSSRLGDLAAELLGEPAVRLYHDNALSKEPGCGRTPWHHDAEHFPLATVRAVTAWIPVTAIPAYMGPLALARGAHLRDVVAGLSFDKIGTTYDAAVERRFVESDVAVDASPFAVGEVSFHSALCFHTAGPNRSTQPRRALATTYYADGARVVDSPTLISGSWRDFLPGVDPGGLAVSTLNPIVGSLPTETSHSLSG